MKSFVFEITLIVLVLINGLSGIKMRNKIDLTKYDDNRIENLKESYSVNNININYNNGSYCLSSSLSNKLSNNNACTCDWIPIFEPEDPCLDCALSCFLILGLEFSCCDGPNCCCYPVAGSCAQPGVSCTQNCC
mmetsp:Transcript_86824/g.106499  ORF Transcript_86824/g.106499 Transcript_86824/m.106499 type:complete len:134 (-) Transcript_86824:124-525(-)